MGYIPISQSLPHTSLASLQSGGLAGRNLGQELAIPAKLGDKRTVEELNMILVNILVSSGPNGGHHLRTFRAIQWECECELYRDRGRPKGSLLSIHGQQLRLARAGGLSKPWRLPLAPPRSRRPAPCRRSRSHRARRAAERPCGALPRRRRRRPTRRGWRRRRGLLHFRKTPTQLKILTPHVI